VIGDESRLSPQVRVVYAAKQGDVDFLIAALVDTDRHVRWLAARSLGELKAYRGVDGLMRWAANASDDTFRANCIFALQEIGDLRAIDLLHEIATSSSTFGVKTCAMVALGVLGDRRAIPLLAAIVTDPRLVETYPVALGDVPLSERVAKKWAAKQLVTLQGVEAIPTLESAARRAPWPARLRIRRLIWRLSRQSTGG
jgi:HEAT repeat protein